MIRTTWSNGDALDAETLLGDDSDDFEAALSVPGQSIAVVGEPYGGRSTVLESARRRLDARRLDVGPEDDPGAAIDAVGSGPLVVDGCQHLFAREVGGFGPLVGFLEALAGAGATVVTGWNSYAWSYLAAVEDIETAVPTVATVDGLAADRLAGVIRRSVDTLPTFRRDDLDESLLTVRRRPLPRGRTIPIPAPNRAAIEARWADRPSPQDAVFERLAAASNGNPGAALALLERCRNGDEIRPSDVRLPTTGLSIDREAALCLRIVLATERVRRGWLADRFDGSIDRLLGRFARSGLLVRDGDLVGIEPGGVPAAIAITDRERIL